MIASARHSAHKASENDRFHGRVLRGFSKLPPGSLRGWNHRSPTETRRFNRYRPKIQRTPGATALSEKAQIRRECRLVLQPDVSGVEISAEFLAFVGCRL